MQKNLHFAMIAVNIDILHSKSTFGSFETKSRVKSVFQPLVLCSLLKALVADGAGLKERRFCIGFFKA